MGRKKNFEKYFRCELCKQQLPRKGCQQTYCTPCSYQKARSKAKVRVKVEHAEKQCVGCKFNFVPNAHNQKFCTERCRLEHKTREANKAWCERVDKPKKRQDSNRVAYAFFKIKNNEGWLKKFKTVRG